MRGTLIIARLTWLEARRRRIALAAVVCGLLFVAVFATAVFFIHRSLVLDEQANLVVQRSVMQGLMIAGLYVVNFLTIAVAILLSVDTMSGEINSGVIQTLASKPVDRAAIVAGKWLTYACMTAGYLVLMVGGIALSLRFLTGFTAPQVAVPALLMLLGALVMLSVSIAGGVRFTTITNGLVAFAFYGVAFIGGWVEQFGAIAGSEIARRIGTAISLVSPADSMWRKAAYELMPPLMRQFPTPFTGGSTPSTAMVVWAIGFVAVMLGLAIIQFRKRPL